MLPNVHMVPYAGPVFIRHIQLEPRERFPVEEPRQPCHSVGHEEPIVVHVVINYNYTVPEIWVGHARWKIWTLDLAELPIPQGEEKSLGRDRRHSFMLADAARSLSAANDPPRSVSQEVGCRIAPVSHQGYFVLAPMVLFGVVVVAPESCR